MIPQLRNGLVFLSMPYSSDIEGMKDERFEKSLKLLSYLQLAGVHVLSPITQGHPVVKKYKVPSDWEYWAEYCRKLICVCNAVIVFKIDGWQESNGVKGEISWAKKMKKSIYLIDEDYNLEQIF